ncbi:hypothetical protein L2E82_19444 [Cichorium intybus]|uniref:Uncharacterized protein n=1 Tax=Cichorium intybus TaxID=13427 RepID=A0ACB9FBE7_CICIN|nr:hypothetical protein L2E82_19444 [Cichorium intybus]
MLVWMGRARGVANRSSLSIILPLLCFAFHAKRTETQIPSFRLSHLCFSYLASITGPVVSSFLETKTFSLPHILISTYLHLYVLPHLPFRPVSFKKKIVWV